MTRSPSPLDVGSFTVTRGDAWRQESIFQNADETPLDLMAVASIGAGTNVTVGSSYRID